MKEVEMLDWEKRFEQKILDLDYGNDPAHDLAHFRRVVATAKRLAQEEDARLAVVIPAAWFHDFVNVPKNDPRRSQASRLSAAAACEYLRESGYPVVHLDAIYHAIEAHSFSAQIEPRTVEASVVQDADRLDGLGAIGIARCFSVAGLLKRRIYDLDDPFAHERELDDLVYTIDHFYMKLFKTAGTLRSRAGRAEGIRRAHLMKEFLLELAREIGEDPAQVPVPELLRVMA
jgi:uncharacterized protein